MNRPTARLLAALLPSLLAGAASAADYALDDVAIVSPDATYRAAHIEFVGATLSREDAQKLLAADGAQSGAERIAQIDAARISIPELTSDTKTGDYQQKIVYRDLKLENVSHGVAGTLDAAGATIESQRGSQQTKGSFGALHAEGVDFPAAVRMAVETRKSADEPKRRTTASFAMSGMEIEIAGGGKFSVGKITGKDFSGRPLAAPMTGLIELAPKPGAQPTADQQTALALMTGDLMTSIDVGGLEMTDVAIAREAGADTAGEPVATRIRRIAMEGLVDGKVAAFTLEGVENSAKQGAFKLDRITLSGFDWKPMFQAAAQARRAPPHFNRAEISGLSAPLDEGPFSIGRIAIEAKTWLGDAPTAVRADIAHLALSLAGPAAHRAPLFAALGYDKLDIGGSLDATFDPDKKELTVSEVTLRDDSIGVARIGAFLAHVSPDIISGNDDLMRSALAAIVFWSADLHLENFGILDRYIDAQAKQTGKQPAGVRELMATGARAMAHSLFPTAGKPDPRIDRFADAAAAFVKGAKTFDLLVSAPDGLGAIDLMMAGRLGALGDQLRIEAKAH